MSVCKSWWKCWRGSQCWHGHNSRWYQSPSATRPTIKRRFDLWGWLLWDQELVKNRIKFRSRLISTFCSPLGLICRTKCLKYLKKEKQPRFFFTQYCIKLKYLMVFNSSSPLCRISTAKWGIKCKGLIPYGGPWPIPWSDVWDREGRLNGRGRPRAS